MKSLILFLCVLLTSPAGAAIYGTDDRAEVFEHPASSSQRKAAQAVALLPLKHQLHRSDQGSISLNFRSLAQELLRLEEPLCAAERFHDQPASHDSVGTGFLIGSDILVTAGHVIANQADCNKRLIVFGQMIDPETGLTPAIQDKDVYECAAIIATAQQGSPLVDFAIIRLDRPVEGRTWLNLRQKGTLSASDSVSMVGHPWGLPMKITSNGAVYHNTAPTYFSAFLDTYPGNSGSPVLNSKTGLVEGILVEGEVGDTTIEGEWPDGCWYSKVYCHSALPYAGRCDDTTSKGAVIIRASVLLPFIPVSQ